MSMAMHDSEAVRARILSREAGVLEARQVELGSLMAERKASYDQNPLDRLAYQVMKLESLIITRMIEKAEDVDAAKASHDSAIAELRACIEAFDAPTSGGMQDERVSHWLSARADRRWLRRIADGNPDFADIEYLTADEGEVIAEALRKELKSRETTPSATDADPVLTRLLAATKESHHETIRALYAAGPDLEDLRGSVTQRWKLNRQARKLGYADLLQTARKANDPAVEQKASNDTSALSIDDLKQRLAKVEETVETARQTQIVAVELGYDVENYRQNLLDNAEQEYESILSSFLVALTGEDEDERDHLAREFGLITEDGIAPALQEAMQTAAIMRPLELMAEKAACGWDLLEEASNFPAHIPHGNSYVGDIAKAATPSAARDVIVRAAMAMRANAATPAEPEPASTAMPALPEIQPVTEPEESEPVTEPEDKTTNPGKTDAEMADEADSVVEASTETESDIDPIEEYRQIRESSGFVPDRLAIEA